MRKLPLSSIRSGMTLGRDIYAEDQSLLLSGGRILSDREIQRINNFQYQAVFIVDDILAKLDLPDEYEDIDSQVRQNAVITTKDIFALAEDKKSLDRHAIDNAKKAVNEIIGEVVHNQRLTYSMTDLRLFDDYTYYHSVNVTVISVILGAAMGLNQNKLMQLGLAGLMHDIGKIFVPKELIAKKGKLTDEEFEIVKAHSQAGYDYMQKTQGFPTESNVGVRTHHERFNGSGYPDGLAGMDIPLFGRILMVADVFDALVSNRPYRKAMAASDAVEYIIGNSGQLFDPQVVAAFIGKIAPYPVGTHVSLSNGQRAVVIENRANFGLRPKVKVLNHENNGLYYDLSREFFDITIVGAIYS